jgi:hypothetical protein
MLAKADRVREHPAHTALSRHSREWGLEIHNFAPWRREKAGSVRRSPTFSLETIDENRSHKWFRIRSCRISLSEKQDSCYGVCMSLSAIHTRLPMHAELFSTSRKAKNFGRHRNLFGGRPPNFRPVQILVSRTLLKKSAARIRSSCDRLSDLYSRFFRRAPTNPSSRLGRAKVLETTLSGWSSRREAQRRSPIPAPAFSRPRCAPSGGGRSREGENFPGCKPLKTIKTEKESPSSAPAAEGPRLRGEDPHPAQ